jgi:hypothetical protein
MSSDPIKWSTEWVYPLVKGLDRILNHDGNISIHAVDRPGSPVLSIFTSQMAALEYGILSIHKCGKRSKQSIITFRRL